MGGRPRRRGARAGGGVIGALQRRCSGTRSACWRRRARSLDLDDDGVMEKPIEQCGGDDQIAEDVAPFGEAAIRGEDHGTFLVAGVDQLEEQVAAGDDRQVADLVDDEQRGAGEPADAFAQAPLAVGLGQRGDDIGEGREVDAAAGLTASTPSATARCDLPVPGGPRT